MPLDDKPRTNGFVTTSLGNRVKVDELDMAVLNIGHGNNPMTNSHLDAGRGNFRRPIYNVEPSADLHDDPRRHSAGSMSHEVFGDANNPETIRQSTGLHQFDQIHAINPYAYDPVRTASSLLAPQGQLVVTGTGRNPFAHPVDTATDVPANIGTRQEPKKITVQRISHVGTDLTLSQSTSEGVMHPMHGRFPHQLSDGKAMQTGTSRSHTYHQVPHGFENVTPVQDLQTATNTMANTGRRMSIAEANLQWQSLDMSSPKPQALSKPKKSVRFSE